MYCIDLSTFFCHGVRPHRSPDLPAAGEEKEIVIPISRPKLGKEVGSLSLIIKDRSNHQCTPTPITYT